MVDIAKVVSPGFRFTPTIVRHGHRITVRQGEGVHLSQAGAQVAAGLVRDAGFDPVEVGKLTDARRFQRGAPGYGQNVSASELKQKLSLAP